MRLTTRTNLAMRVLMFCAVNPGRIVRKHEIAEACNASENHLAQVVNTLGQLGFVETLRGRAGGMQLARQTDNIRVGEVFRAFETGVPFAECFDAEHNTCPLAGCCRLQRALKQALEAFYSALDELTLTELVAGNTQLEHLLALADRRKPAGCIGSA
ncbi:MAG: Rrf2 family transcriptional regulator [Rhodobacteraceae bacterium]|nr:Rrf2 family transcriptional regulator [Paracoccaceae bacterium]